MKKLLGIVFLCPFCDSAVLERQTIYRNEWCAALLDYKPAVLGHVLVIPNRHVERFEDLYEEEVVAIHAMIKKVHAVEQKIFGATGYVLLQKNGKEAGQTVPHVHFHYLPRKVGQSNLWLALKIFTAHWQRPMSTNEIEKIRQQFLNQER